MNWTHRRPFRHQFNYGRGMNKVIPINRGRQMITDQPIDAIRLQLSDNEPCPVHHSRREHPYITTFSDQQSSVRRTRSSIHSISTIETDFVHQRVSTIHTYPSSTSIIQRQEIINEVNDVNDDQQQNSIDQIISCRTCTMFMEILDQQTQQIRQYTEQISQQADLIAKLARRIAAFEEGIDDRSLDNTSQQHTIHQNITT